MLNHMSMHSLVLYIILDNFFVNSGVAQIGKACALHVDPDKNEFEFNSCLGYFFFTLSFFSFSFFFFFTTSSFFGI